MSLLRLLTDGKSLVGLKKSEKRYQLPGQMGLPTFGSKKNPFRATATPDKSEPDQQSGAQSPPSSSPATEPGDDEVSFAEKKMLEAQNNPGARALERPARRGSALKALLLWTRARKAKPAGLTLGKPMVQGELSLDSVKVVRNDLSETDVEIVPRRKASSSKGPVSSMAAAREPAVQPAGWDGLAGSILSVSRM